MTSAETLIATPNVSRVSATPAAVELMQKLVAMHGPLMFHQSGGCCDGSAPMCYPRIDFKVGAQDVFMGEGGRREATAADIRRALKLYWTADALVIGFFALCAIVGLTW